MGGASAYVWLYLLCGIAIGILAALGGVLWWFGRGTNREGRARAVAIRPESERPRPEEGRGLSD